MYLPCEMPRCSLLVLYVIAICHVSTDVAATGCNIPHFEKCYCDYKKIDETSQYVFNCTDTEFKNISMLTTLPQQTQILVFQGNQFDELPWNVFGINNTNLNEVNLSNNQIKTVKGKSFHHVRNVFRLILDFNKIDITETRDHPRIFSNFENLRELHLTDAFDDDVPREEFAYDLRNIFKNSKLIKLQKLHLEQNEIANFDDAPDVFCEIPNLLDIYLGYNYLTHVNFNFNCLKSLRYLDFKQNRIAIFNKNDYELLDALPRRSQHLMIALYGNPLSCDKKPNIFDWFDQTNVTIRQKEKLKCHVETACGLKPVIESGSDGGLIAVLSISLVISVSALVYTNRNPIRSTVYPVLLSLSKNIQYTTIGRQEATEMDV